MPTNMNKSFQNPNSSTLEHLMMFNDHLIMMCTMNLMMISTFMMISKMKITIKMSEQENNKMESFWTLTPLTILVSISIPSMMILYMTEEMNNPSMTIKITGNQWYWSYEYPEMNNLFFNSMLKNKTPFRLLETNNPMILMAKTKTRFISTSNDVIHSWSISSMGTKMDSIPGRLNSSMNFPKKSGIMTGQCSEICGMNHSFMPIWIMSMNMKSLKS